MLSQDIVDSLFPPDLPEPDHWEHRYPPRDLPEEKLSALSGLTLIAPAAPGGGWDQLAREMEREIERRALTPMVQVENVKSSRSLSFVATLLAFLNQLSMEASLLYTMRRSAKKLQENAVRDAPSTIFLNRLRGITSA